MRTRYILIDSKRGVFLGVDSHYAYFSTVNPIESYKATTFKTPEEALEFGKEVLNYNAEYDYEAAPVKVAGKFATALEIIQAGKGEHIGDMFAYMPGASSTIH